MLLALTDSSLPVVCVVRVRLAGVKRSWLACNIVSERSPPLIWCNSANVHASSALVGQKLTQGALHV